MTRRCPDCAVTMEQITLRDGSGMRLTASTGEKKEGLLGKLGVSESAAVETVACPECGLLRAYLSE